MVELYCSLENKVIGEIDVQNEATLDFIFLSTHFNPVSKEYKLRGLPTKGLAMCPKCKSRLDLLLDKDRYALNVGVTRVKVGK